MNIGDRFRSRISFGKSITKGNSYTIIRIGIYQKCIAFIDNEDDMHWISTDDIELIYS